MPGKCGLCCLACLPAPASPHVASAGNAGSSPPWWLLPTPPPASQPPGEGGARSVDPALLGRCPEPGGLSCPFARESSLGPLSPGPNGFLFKVSSDILITNRGQPSLSGPQALWRSESACHRCGGDGQDQAEGWMLTKERRPGGWEPGPAPRSPTGAGPLPPSLPALAGQPLSLEDALEWRGTGQEACPVLPPRRAGSLGCCLSVCTVSFLATATPCPPATSSCLLSLVGSTWSREAPARGGGPAARSQGWQGSGGRLPASCRRAGADAAGLHVPGRAKLWLLAAREAAQEPAPCSRVTACKGVGDSSPAAVFSCWTWAVLAGEAGGRGQGWWARGHPAPHVTPAAWA